MHPTPTAASLSARNLVSGVLFGIGLVAFVDETVFHQLLHWHHFYDRSTTSAGLVSDGLFHAASWIATIAALFLLAEIRRQQGWWHARWIGGVCLGAGAFQLYDGIVQHKWMRLHQIRYHVDIVPYDVVWNVIAAVILLAGIVLVWRTGSRQFSPR